MTLLSMVSIAVSRGILSGLSQGKVYIDMSIELMQCQDEREASYAFHLDSSEAYPLMMCLQGLYKQMEM